MSGEALAHRVAIAKRFADRMEDGTAFFLGDASDIPDLPYTVKDGARREFSGVNALMLMQVMRDRGWRDARFFTFDQVASHGWNVAQDAPSIALQFLRAVDADGEVTQEPVVERFRVVNAGDIEGELPNAGGRRPAPDVLRASLGDADPSAELGVALGERLMVVAYEQGDSAEALSLFAGLDWKLAAAALSVQLGVDVRVPASEVEVGAWVAMVRADPLSFFGAARSAQVLAEIVGRNVRLAEVGRATVREIVEAEQEVGQEFGQEKVAVKTDLGVGMVGKASARVEAMFAEREAVLSVPFMDRKRASALGAMWYAPQKLWFVPKGLSVEPFKEWDVRTQSLGLVASTQEYFSSFAKAMVDLGLEVPEVILADGKWHNVRVTTRSTSNKSGAYIFSLNGARDGGPIGTINNKDTGESFTWKYDGALLTPEQKARARAEAKEREARAEREILEAQDRAAVVAQKIWTAGEPADKHGYVVKKGISPLGLRQVRGSVLLQYEAFKSDSGTSAIKANESYLLVPMWNDVGVLRGVQAISPDGALKAFMRGAQKKGCMFVLGADNFEALAASGAPAVAYGEGVATCKSVEKGGDLPVIVCFDAGNLEVVVANTAKKLPANMARVLAVDNDQFFVERALGFLSEKVGLNPVAPGGTQVVVANGKLPRSIWLGELKADGQLHTAPKGTYKASLVMEEGSDVVRSMVVEVTPAGGRTIRSTFENRGVEAGRKALESLKKVESKECELSKRAVMVIPEFLNVKGKPTDFNDLEKAGGVASVRHLLGMYGVPAPAVESKAVERSEMRRTAGVER